MKFHGFNGCFPQTAKGGHKWRYEFELNFFLQTIFEKYLTVLLRLQKFPKKFEPLSEKILSVFNDEHWNVVVQQHAFELKSFTNSMCTAFVAWPHMF